MISGSIRLRPAGRARERADARGRRELDRHGRQLHLAGEDLDNVRGVRAVLRQALQAEQRELHAERGLVLVLGVVQPLVH